MKNLIPAFIAVFSMFLVSACSSGTPSDSELLAQAKLEGSFSNQRNSVEAAAITSTAVLSAMGLASSSDVQNTIKSSAIKLTEISGLNCAPGLATTIDTIFDGSLTVTGDCEPSSGEDCSYNFTGQVFFNFLLIGPPGRILTGKHDVVLEIKFPNCTSDLNQALISISLRGLATVGDLQMLQVNAAFRAMVDPLDGLVSLVVQSFSAFGQFRGLNCLSSLTSTACFVDADSDLINDDVDNCVPLTNQEQTDNDGDGVGDLCDNCPLTANSDQADGDADGQGDACLLICGPGIDVCQSSADCDVNLLCLNGCCRGECPAVGTPESNSPYIDLTCQEAETLNQDKGFSGGCETFSHACSTEGCCELLRTTEDPPFDYCDSNCEANGGFCFRLGEAVVCNYDNSFGGVCPDIFPGAAFGFGCEDFGQLACNDLIVSAASSGFVSLNVSCVNGCCVEP